MASRHKWTLEENTKVMECFYKSSPARRGHRKRMYKQWKTECPGFVLTEQRLLDVSIPADFNIVEKEHEKVLKYQDLCLALQQIWNLQTIKFVSIVIGITAQIIYN